MTIVTNSFLTLALTLAKAKGFPGLNLVVVSHPIGGLQTEEVAAKMRSKVAEVHGALTSGTGEGQQRSSTNREQMMFKPPRPRLAFGPLNVGGGKSE